MAEPMRDLLRVYVPGVDEFDRYGYPLAWAHGDMPIKDRVRDQAGHRCVRCGHPYRNGAHGSGEWSPCDRRCSHRGPVRLSYRAHDGSEVVNLEHSLGTTAAIAVHYGKKVEAHWRILTVHHLTGAKADCRWWNLAALCQRCHLEIQGRVVMDRAYPWEHSTWFKPYVAGFYAWKYGGEELSREETLARLDEVLGAWPPRGIGGKDAAVIGPLVSKRSTGALYAAN